MMFAERMYCEVCPSKLGRFGSFNNLRLMCGFTPTLPPKANSICVYKGV